MAVNLYIGFAQPDEWAGWAGTYAKHTHRFEEASGGTPCLVVPFNHATPELIERIRPQAVVMSGFARSFEQYKVASFFPVIDWVKSTQTPILALCGSHQLLGFAYNSDIRSVQRLADEPIRHLRAREPITNPDYHPDFYMERGFYTVDLTDEGRTDPLFEGISVAPLFCESHYCEIKTLPPDFTLLGSTPECKIQAIRHRNRTLYGVQFHPEDYVAAPPHLSAGKRLLENFFKIARNAHSV